MNSVYYKTLTMMAAILIGYFCRRRGVFLRSDAKVISKLLMNVILPCVVIKNMNGLTLDLDILAAAVIGVLVNAFFFLQSFVFSRASDPEDRIVKLFSFSSFNVGNYVIPLLDGLLSPHALAGLLVFNYLGTALFTYGFPPVAGSMLYSTEEAAGSVWRRLKDALSHNVALLTCVFMLALSLLRLSLPGPVAEICGTLGSANATLAMLSVGILLDLSFPKEELFYYLRIIVIRFGCAVVCALAVWFLAPVSAELRRTLALTVFAPISTVMPSLALHCGYTGGKVANVNSLYLPVSIVAMTVLMLLLY